MMKQILAIVGLYILSVELIHAESAGVHEYLLDNGMKVIVKEDHRAPVVISQLWYKVGSADEYSGITGVSHVLEHMMFKGTKRYPGGRFSEIIADNGGSENAFTSRDYTGYYQLLEKTRLPISFELEADRMRHLTLPPEAFAKELEIVKEERRQRTEDNPNALAYEQLHATAFNNGPYAQPVIGWMGDLNAMQVDDLKHWYETWYRPNNATLVVVGDVDPKAVQRLANTHFGVLEPQPLSTRKARSEAPQYGERRAVIRVPAKLPYLLAGYKAPVLGDEVSQWEPYALEVLAGILDGGRSARLTKQLVREQEIAASAGAGYALYGRYEGLFVLDGTPASGHAVEELEQAIDREIQRLRTERVTEAELKRVKAQVIANEVYEQDSVSQQASLIGQVETIGLGWRVLDEYVERVQAVSAEQVREVAEKYLIDNHKTVVVVDPLPIEASTVDATAQARS